VSVAKRTKEYFLRTGPGPFYLAAEAGRPWGLTDSTMILHFLWLAVHRKLLRKLYGAV